MSSSEEFDFMDLEPTEEELETQRAMEVAEAEAEADICERCGIANIPYENVRSRISIYLPDTSNSRRQLVAENLHQKLSLQSIEFEKVVFISGYDAIYIPEEGLIDAAIMPADPGDSLTSRGFYERLLGKQIIPRGGGSHAHWSKTLTLSLTGELQGRNVVITIGPQPVVFDTLLQLSDSKHQSREIKSYEELNWTEPSITISNLDIPSTDEAAKYLKRISDALFFQIDYRRRLPLVLRRESTRSTTVRSIRTGRELVFPRRQYDDRPMSLYWYGRSARELPLLQFLAFYQVIEFYFPVYANLEATQRLKDIMSQPSFSPASDESLLSLLNVIRIKGTMSERAQLKVTLEHCLSMEDLKRFLGADQKRMERLTTESPVSSKTLPLPTGPNKQLLEGLVHRIYDIRCKIVHTKSGGDVGPVIFLLPFSEEAKALDDDIELIQFVAQKVLMKGGKELQV